ncbi:hypothetical protein J1605_001899 [Eschrichtius robustus]|uniref:Glyceraldehyde-3-phosphate dehydrogenase n=1 Tax=Eschrichtius robustus TaxID=9764 RepID=A0AB34I3B2_ESCRO|nr:hypothetical protein J1605_001899 [Eschrichtius robustus]
MANCRSQNVIPGFISSGKALGKVIPELNGKLFGMAFHIPTPNTTVMDLTCHLQEANKHYCIKKVGKQGSKGAQKGVQAYRGTGLIIKTFTVTPPNCNAETGTALNRQNIKLIS